MNEQNKKNLALQEVSTEFVAQINHGTQAQFICSAKLKTASGVTVQAVGDGKSLQDAAANARMEVKRLLNNHFGMATPDTQPPAPSLPTRGSRRADSGKYNGGGDKPASRNQQNLISKMAYERDKSVEQLCRKHCNKSLTELTGSEADQIIKRLKSMN